MQIITVGSVTYAIKTKKMLNKNGIRSKLVKLDSSKTASGCTYGIQFSDEDLYNAASLLRLEGIEYHLYNGKNDIL